MNNYDLNTLRLFADLTLQYLTEGLEYEQSGLWQNLDNERKLRERLIKLSPIIEFIINTTEKP